MNNVLTRDLHNEKELLALASQADEGAFTLLFHMYKNKLYGYLFRLTESEMLSEDIVQDVFMKLWNDHQSLSSIENFGSYLFRMSKNHVINHFKRMAHETSIMAEMFGQNSAGHNETLDIIALKDVEKLLAEILEKLPAQQKIVYHLSREEGRTHDEIANLLKISPNTVKNHIVQAMSTIRTNLRRHADTMLTIALILSLKK
ncbi:RNA polymerase sigma-70 factor, ECF subfamily [Dyadobacter koreensis]|uniref:RNA polymerase sigma-70 factor, ECF subfamily n=1 Tax=Dyadobacter koreensis TaxID=408657 RepID=A0A1H6XFL1_9BACT|nr:RNA polymerase sigma-70 factor [Dyadobacter koreensis]SEJ27911.1 RNA polymerase sigma-70 factor, ECF subfamily [Dyadobacter koreensis]